jgi:hypothetical protein
MINYNDQNIFNKDNKKCLTFDPFETKNQTYLIKLKDKKRENELKEEFYTCSENCFDLYENLPVFNYHYKISCLCIKDCYEKVKEKENS